MKKKHSKKARILRNALLLLLLLAAGFYFSGFPLPIPELQFRREERAHLVGPGTIIGREDIDFSGYETMIVAETEEGLILWVAGHEIDRSNLIYREKTGGNLLLAAPGELGYMTVAEETNLPLILFDRYPKAARAELQFTLREEIDGEIFEKSYQLSADRETSGYFLFTLNARRQTESGTDPELLTLQIFANAASGRDWNINYRVPIQVRFYDSRDILLAEETVIISGQNTDRNY